jgi:hypothetical protein
MTSYLIELRTSNINSCESSSIMALMWTWSVIHSDSLLIIYICIGLALTAVLVLAFLSLAAKYSCWLLLSLPLLEEVYSVQPESTHILWSLLFFWDIKSFLFSSLFEKLAVFWLYCVACSSSEVLKSFRFYSCMISCMYFLLPFSIYCSECRRSLYWSYSHWIWFWSAFTFSETQVTCSLLKRFNNHHLMSDTLWVNGSWFCGS